MKTDRMTAAPARVLVAAIIAFTPSACSTTQALDVPKPTPREEPVNSLALEQCVRAHGAEQCATDGTANEIQ